jgi:uncharacterized membrane protein (DUF485 family)
VRSRLYAKWDDEGTWRPHWWDRLIVWASALLGTYLLLFGDGTVDRVFGIGMVVMPAVITAIWLWVYWKALQMLRRERR